jgi:hypothetical protein
MAEAAKTAVYLLNRSPTKANNGETPEARFIGVRPNLSHLRSFGCLSYVHILEEKRDKLSPRSQHGILVGYDDSAKAYRIYLPHRRTVTVSRDVRFDELRFYRAEPTDLPFDVQELLELRPISSTATRSN